MLNRIRCDEDPLGKKRIELLQDVNYQAHLFSLQAIREGKKSKEKKLEYLIILYRSDKYRVCQGFRISKRNGYYQVTF